MAGFDRISASVGNQIQQGVAAGTLTADQATQLNGDLSGLQNALASGDPSQVRQAYQQLKTDGKADGIKVPHHHHKHGAGGGGGANPLDQILQAAQAGDPQATEMMGQIQQIATAAQGGDANAQAILAQLMPPRPSIGSQMAAGNPYLNATDSFER